MAKIMLVEDDNNLREIYEARLQAEGYVIVSAKDGEEALVVAKNERPELIISDVMMPKISGFEMLDILRNTDGLKDVKVIMLTALGQADDQQRADRLGADRYLVKSQVTLEDIVNAAHQLLEDTPAPVAVAAAPAAIETPTAPVAPEPTAAPATPVVVAGVAVSSPAAVEPAAAPSQPTAAITTPVVASPAPVTPIADPVTPVAANPTPPPAAEVQGDAQSTAAEEAGVEAKIEDFVAGASSDAGPAAESADPTPAAEPAPATPPPAIETTPVAPPISPEPAAAPIAEPTVTFTSVESSAPATAAVPPAPAASADQISDDKLMAKAVDTIVASAQSSIAPRPTDDTAKPESTPTEAAVASASDAPVVAHKKVIAPIDSEPKPDLNQLLALEEAKETLTQPVPGATVATPPPPAAASSDPSSIAL